MQSRRSHGFGRSLPRLVAALMLAGGAGAQAPQAPDVRASESAPPFQIRVETNLVTVRVVVRDAKGHAVGNLRKEDFRLFDDGKPQEIAGFSVEPGAPVEAQPGAGARTAPTAVVPERFVALYFDDLHIDSATIGQTRDAAWRYISTALQPDDRVAIFTSSNQGAADFTSEREKLHAALLRLAARSRTNSLEHQCPAIGEYEAFLIAERQQSDVLEIAEQEGYHCHCEHGNDTEECRHSEHIGAQMLASQISNLADAQSQEALDVLERVVDLLAARPGQRDLVLMSPGFLSATRTKSVDAVIDRALRRNIVVNALDSAGLYGKAYHEPQLAGHPDLETRKFRIENEGLTVQRDVLAALAAGTGGTFFHNSNDLDSGLRQTAQAPEVYYVLSFSPQDVKPDGKFHALKVTLSSGDRLQVEARRGYFATSEKTPARSELETWMFSQDARQDLPATATALPATSGVTVKIHVDIQDLPFRKQGDRNLDTLIFDTALFDRDGKHVAGKESSLDFHLTDARLEQLRQSGINAETSFRVPPGAYRIREVVRDTESKKLSALNCSVEVTAQPAETAASREPAAKAIPEPAGLAPAANQDRLAALLAGTGENVKRLFDALPATSAREEITLDRVDGVDHARAEFNYLDLPHSGNEGVGRDEFRTNAAGQRVEAEPLENGLVTKGFASMIAPFHPMYQSESTFRYVGTETVNGHATDVVSFAQIPGKGRATQPQQDLVQGLAWIDSGSHQIVRTRTELLSPNDNPDLKMATTEVRFAAVQLPDYPQTFWLPAEATVTLKRRGATFRNIHAYSGYGLVSAPPSDMTPQDALLGRFKTKIRQILSEVPNYTCLETVQRSVQGPRAKAFSALDTVLLEVSTVKDKELLAWPGARRFEEADLSSFVNGGLLGNGVFAAHARNVFLHDTTTIKFSGHEELAGRPVARFDFRVPQASSGYNIQTKGSSAQVGTRGSFWVDPASLELVRLDVRADEIPAGLGIQRAATVIDYAPMRIGDSAVLLPQAASTLLTLSSGEIRRNGIQFSHCREYHAESAIRFDMPETPAAALAPQTQTVELPAGLAVSIDLDTAIDSNTAHVGDLLRGHVTNEVRRKGKTIIPRGAIVTGRVRGLEHSQPPQPVIDLTIEITELEWGNSRAEFYGEMLASEPRRGADNALLNLPSISGGTPEMPLTVGGATEAVHAPQIPGTGVLRMAGSRFRIAAGLRMSWRTLEPNQRLKKMK